MLALDKTKFWAVALFIVVAVVWFLLAPSLYAQTLSNDRVGLNRLVRDFLVEKEMYDTDRVPDTTLNRMLHYAQYRVQLDLSRFTNVDTDTILATRGVMLYNLDNNAIGGRVVGAVRRVEEDQGGGDVGMVQVDIGQIGKLGEGVIPNSYTVFGQHFVLATAPTGNDTFFVYYLPKPQDLAADDSTLYVAEEDLAAVAYLTASWVYASKGNLALAGYWLELYRGHIRAKRNDVIASQEPGQ